MDKYVEEETRVDDVSTRKCGQNIDGENKNCKDRTITGTMTTVYFPRVEGHGTDDFHGKFKERDEYTQVFAFVFAVFLRPNS